MLSYESNLFHTGTQRELVTLGNSYGELSYSVVAYNAGRLEVIWQDMQKHSTEEGITTVMGLGKFAELPPRLLELTRDVSVKIIHNLDGQLQI